MLRPAVILSAVRIWLRTLPTVLPLPVWAAKWAQPWVTLLASSIRDFSWLRISWCRLLRLLFLRLLFSKALAMLLSRCRRNAAAILFRLLPWRASSACAISALLFRAILLLMRTLSRFRVRCRVIRMRLLWLRVLLYRALLLS